MHANKFVFSARKADVPVSNHICLYLSLVPPALGIFVYFSVAFFSLNINKLFNSNKQLAVVIV